MLIRSRALLSSSLTPSSFSCSRSRLIRMAPNSSNDLPETCSITGYAAARIAWASSSQSSLIVLMRRTTASTVAGDDRGHHVVALDGPVDEVVAPPDHVIDPQRHFLGESELPKTL